MLEKQFDYILSKTNFKPSTAIVLGSGLEILPMGLRLKQQ